ncbi:hypothetical protein B9Z19DRAFT_1076698 [Tuber borchii]|uniref:Uncharacterized protein n=1 Tax=Tuber borchii TaxID=42251 RepID=A0A2T7A1R4_TUBBO|nr:hypothetical protein B9Z19DRAFT_1076698 [Tuber borchii]
MWGYYFLLPVNFPLIGRKLLLSQLDALPSCQLFTISLPGACTFGLVMVIYTKGFLIPIKQGKGSAHGPTTRTMKNGCEWHLQIFLLFWGLLVVSPFLSAFFFWGRMCGWSHTRGTVGLGTLDRVGMYFFC